VDRDNRYDLIVLNIKKIITNKNLKQSGVAKQCGFSDSEFSNMLNDRRKLIRVEFLPDIASALGVEINELFKSD